MVDGPNLYAYVRNNPIVFHDPGGQYRLEMEMGVPGSTPVDAPEETTEAEGPSILGSAVDEAATMAGTTVIGASKAMNTAFDAVVGDLIYPGKGEAARDTIGEAYHALDQSVGRQVAEGGGGVRGQLHLLNKNLNPVMWHKKGSEEFAAAIESGDKDQIGRKGVHYALGVLGLTGAAKLLTQKIGAKAGVAPVASLSEAVPTSTQLSMAAKRAHSMVGPGSGSVHGTRVHAAFKKEVDILGRTELRTEISYLNGRRVKHGTKGSIRLDVVEGPIDAPTAVFDLKTGKAKLTPSRIEQIRSHLPIGYQSIQIMEIR